MNMKRIKALALAALLCFGTLLGACGGQDSNESTGGSSLSSTEAEYKVHVVDANGEPYTSGVIVCFMQNGTQVAMQAVDANGVAAKIMDKGTYTVELVFTGDADDYYYDNSGLELTAETTGLDVVLAYTVGEGTSLYVDGESYTACQVGTGCTYVELTEGQRNYLLFTPEIAGTYEFTVSGSNEPIGYYGSPYFVQSQSLTEVVDNAFEISVESSMIGTGNTGTTVIVIGIDAGDSENCVLSVRRTGDPAWSVSSEPWNVYQTTAQLSSFELNADTQIHEFDLTAAADTYKLVFNENDGFYHLDSADGPLVLVRLTEDSKYLDSVEMVLSRSGMSAYFYNGDGSFDRKESYTECLLEYIEYADETFGVYPLTEDLMYIIQQRGSYVGWWDVDSASYLFLDEASNPLTDINTEIAWLFMCCYADVD